MMHGPRSNELSNGRQKFAGFTAYRLPYVHAAKSKPAQHVTASRSLQRPRNTHYLGTSMRDSTKYIVPEILAYINNYSDRELTSVSSIRRGRYLRWLTVDKGRLRQVFHRRIFQGLSYLSGDLTAMEHEKELLCKTFRPQNYSQPA